MAITATVQHRILMEPLSTSILVIMYFGDVVFAISGALLASRYRMDIIGYVM